MFCTNCGKKLPDGAAGPLCEACAAEKLSGTAQSAAPKAAPKTASQLLKSSGKTAKAGASALKAGLKAKLVAAVAGVTAACAVVGFGAHAVFGETKQEKIWNGMEDVLTLEEQYTMLDLAQDITGELGAFGKEGGSKLSAQVTVPGEGTIDLDLGLKRDGKEHLITLQGDLLGVSLEPTRLYFDTKQAALDLLGSDQFFSVKYADLVKSLVASEAMSETDAGKLRDLLVESLTETRDMTEELQEAFQDCAESVMPEKLGKKDGKTEWAGDTYTAYTLRLDNETAVQFLRDLGDAVMADKTLRPYINDAVETAKLRGQLPEDFDLNTAWADLKLELNTLQVFNGLKLTAYFDGKTCVGFEGKVTNLMGERADVNVTVRHTPDEDGVYDRVLEAVYIDSRNREYGLRYKGTWTGNDLDCTEDGVLTLMDGGSNQVIPLTLRHTVEKDLTTDRLTVRGITFEHRREGSYTAKKFTAEYSCNVLGYGAQLELSYNKSDDRVSAPKSTVLTDGSAEFFDKEALKKLETVLYDLQKTAGRLEDKLDF